MTRGRAVRAGGHVRRGLPAASVIPNKRFLTPAVNFGCSVMIAVQRIHTATAVLPVQEVCSGGPAAAQTSCTAPVRRSSAPEAPDLLSGPDLLGHSHRSDMLGHVEEPPSPNLRAAEVLRLQRAAEAAAKALAVEKAARRDESAAAAAEMAQLTERLSAAEAMKQEVGFSDMSDISWPDVSDPESMESGLGRGRTSYPLAGQATLIRGARRWSEELTLFQPWRSHTLKGLSKDCISHWTESNEAEFRDGMYHSGFKWRVFMMSSNAFSVCLMVLVDPDRAVYFTDLLRDNTCRSSKRQDGNKRRDRGHRNRRTLLLFYELARLAPYELTHVRASPGDCAAG